MLIRLSTNQCAEVVSYLAYAKINLGLLVLEKRPDGYHSIQTVLHRIDLFDEIALSSSTTITVESSSSIVPCDERNICFKAARLLQDHLGIRAGVKISIQKNIPVGAGLGGGSSDAAEVLLHLPSYWGRTVSKEWLHAFALQLGSDVPYFLNPGSALAQGRGEKLDYFELDVPYAIVLCNPGIHVSTAWAYRHVRPHHRKVDLKRTVIEGMRNPAALSALTNDFESAVFHEHAAIGQIKETMLREGALCSLLSGSGSSVYGLFSSKHDAESAAGALTQHGYAVSVTEPRFQAA